MRHRPLQADCLSTRSPVGGAVCEVCPWRRGLMVYSLTPLHQHSMYFRGQSLASAVAPRVHAFRHSSGKCPVLPKAIEEGRRMFRFPLVTPQHTPVFSQGQRERWRGREGAGTSFSCSKEQLPLNAFLGGMSTFCSGQGQGLSQLGTWG